LVIKEGSTVIVLLGSHVDFSKPLPSQHADIEPGVYETSCSSMWLNVIDSHNNMCLPHSRNMFLAQLPH